MTWSESRPGHYQRRIGENEKFIKAIGDRAHASGREHWSITSQASFKVTEPLQGDDLLTKLSRAWKNLRFEHPSIASTAEEETLNYVVPDTNALDRWANETFFVHDENISAGDLIASFKPSPYMTAHYIPKSSQLILHTAHWRTDGFGALQLLNAFFEAFCAATSGRDPSSLPWGEEVGRLVPSVEEVLNLPITVTPEIKATADRYISTLAHVTGAVGVSYLGDKSTLPSGTRSARLTLSQPTTRAIFEACKARDINVLSAVHASVAAITFAGAPADSKHKHYTSTMRFSLRPYLPEPYNTPRFASGLYTGGYMFRIPASQSWTENTRRYNDEYHLGVTREFLLARRQYALDVQSLLRKNPPVDGPPPSEVDISSVDDAELLVCPVHKSGEEDGGSVEILDVSIGVETLTRQMYCFVWTFRDQMKFNLVYNEAFYDAIVPLELLAKLKEVLQTELHI
ncbi:hypothetical protein EPUS_08854 [Endocarpon pusillum Z07020]|uniref:Condensation domain-containing protein n=1 Tax=Endocarpon pusillum (strain Z07020 / HMAS-L-300199) TaxID=1263415 RepID=U1G6J4_ENDPU|nr:uncharacterized protein EPUS_08854 [Endocarpon pusillum Z07020]ERF72997.1 hypothetical protein EPUS_08854 [Endocarpon pusillum Z07020]